MDTNLKLKFDKTKMSMLKYAKKKNPFKRSHAKRHTQVQAPVESEEEETISRSLSDLSLIQTKSSSKTRRTAQGSQAKSPVILPFLMPTREGLSPTSAPTTPLRTVSSTGPPPEPPPKPPRLKKRTKPKERDPLADKESAQPLLGLEEGEEKLDFTCDFKDFIEEINRSYGLLSVENRSVSTGDLSKIHFNGDVPEVGPEDTENQSPNTKPKFKRTASLKTSPDSSPLVTAVKVPSKSASSSPLNLKRHSSFSTRGDLMRVVHSSPDQSRPRPPAKSSPKQDRTETSNTLLDAPQIRMAKRLSNIESDSSSSLDEIVNENSISLKMVSESDTISQSQDSLLASDISHKDVKMSDTSSLVVGSPTHSEVSEERPLPEEPLTMPYDMSPDLVSH